MIVQIILSSTILTFVLLIAFDVIKIPGLSKNEVKTTSVPTTTKSLLTTTTSVPTTTKSLLTTTTSVPTTTKSLLTTTTSVPTTTRLIVPRTFTFSSGNGGNVITSYNNNGKLWGGGGAGGIVIGGVSSPSVNSGNTTQNCGAAGSNGTGFGAGGGGGGNWCVKGWQVGGAGSPGFVYIIEDNKLITNIGTSTYSPLSNGYYTFILMGGGGAGAGFTPNNSGGCSGSIYKAQLLLKTSDKLVINVGAGGTQATITSPAGNGGNTTVYLDTTLLKAVGGLGGGVVDYSASTTISNLTTNFNNPSTNSSSSLGGNSCRVSTGTAQGGTAGGVIAANSLISAMNS